MRKQDRRITQLERNYADAMDKYANCMQEHGEATSRIEYLEDMDKEKTTTIEYQKRQIEILMSGTD